MLENSEFMQVLCSLNVVYWSLIDITNIYLYSFSLEHLYILLFLDSCIFQFDGLIYIDQLL